MTADQLARTLNARRIGKGRWIAKCPAHADKHPSLTISTGRGGNILLKCQSNHCDTKSVLEALGLEWGALFADDRKVDPFWESQRRDREHLELLERQEGLAIMAQAVYPEEREHWAEVESTCALEARELRDKLNPTAATERKKQEEVQRIIAEYGFDELWKCLPESVFDLPARNYE